MPLKAFFIVTIVSLLAFRLALLPQLSLKEGQKIKVTGVIGQEPLGTGSLQKFNLGKFEVTTNRWPEYGYGQKVEVIGKVKVKEYKLYNNYNLYKRYNLTFPEIKVLEESHTKGINQIAIELRRKLRQIFNQIFSKPYDGIVSGIVIGDKSLISKSFYDNLKLTGTLHILVASGMNIAMFTEGVLSFLCYFFKRRISVVLLILLIWFYSLITGMQPPIIRAAIMATLLYLGQFFGRQSEGGSILLTTGAIMILLDPMIVFDIGFQLSFMATAGLVFIQPRIKEIFNCQTRVEGDKKNNTTMSSRPIRQLAERGGIPFPERQRKGFLDFARNDKGLKINASNLINFARSCTAKLMRSDNFTSSISAQIATLPILFSAFGSFNLLSLVINLMILWTIVYILQAGAVIGIIGLFGTIGLLIAKIASYPLLPLLYYLEQVISQSAKIQFMRLSIDKFPLWLVVIYYSIIIVWLRRGKGYRIK